MSTTATETMTGVAPPAIQNRWTRPEARWKDVIRPYTKAEVERLRGTMKIEYTLARLGAERLWKLLQEEDYVPTLGAMTGNQAVQQVHAGLKAINLSGVASGSRCQSGGPGASRPEFVSGKQRSCGGQTNHNGF
jgi:isocitrate lyase